MVNSIKWFKSYAKKQLGAYSEGVVAVHEQVERVLKDICSVSLQRIQHVVAVENGFANWKDLIDAPEVSRQLAIAMIKEPALNDLGIGLPEGWRFPLEERRTRTAAGRLALRGRVEEVMWTVSWLQRNIVPIKSINKRHSSSGLKEIAEPESPRGYLTNGTFIAAAMVAGYSYDASAGPNPSFGMSERSIKMLSTRTSIT